MDSRNSLILVTGATGYIGGRLVIRLLDKGFKVRAVARSMEKIESRSWKDHINIELVQADLHDLKSLDAALKGCSIAYYLVHSMSEKHKDFALADRSAAVNFTALAAQHRLDRIIYLGGLGGDEPEASLHLKSRLEVEKILKSGSVPVTVFRCAHIIGSGSASFEMLRYIVERMPFFIVPESVIETQIQPVCIRNVLYYLEKCLNIKETIGNTYDIGGPEVITYRDLFEIYAEQAGLKKPRLLYSRIPSFILGKKIAHLIARLLLPLSPGISQPLLEGLGVEAVARDHRIRNMIPQPLIRCCSAIDRAIQKDSLKLVDTRWTDAGGLHMPEWIHAGDAAYSGGTLLQGGYKITLECKPAEIWSLVTRIGGYNGWYYGNMLWQIRGWMDQATGGVGLRRGRRHPEKLYTGDALDFWRVLYVEPPFRLILVAEMKLPGEALLNFEIIPFKKGTELRLGTRFRPKGLYGILYWYFLLPFHNILFGGLLREIARRVGKKIILGPEKYRPGPLILDH